MSRIMIEALLIRVIRVIGGLRLRLDRDFGLHRIRNEALLVRGMIHLLKLLSSRLLVT
jgi:hypothetical protein